METHMGSECYLPPGRADIPAFTPAKAGTRISDPEGIQGFLTVYTANNTFTDISQFQKQKSILDGSNAN